MYTLIVFVSFSSVKSIHSINNWHYDDGREQDRFKKLILDLSLNHGVFDNIEVSVDSNTKWDESLSYVGEESKEGEESTKRGITKERLIKKCQS